MSENTSHPMSMYMSPDIVLKNIIYEHYGKLREKTHLLRHVWGIELFFGQTVKIAFFGKSCCNRF